MAAKTAAVFYRGKNGSELPKQKSEKQTPFQKWAKRPEIRAAFERAKSRMAEYEMIDRLRDKAHLHHDEFLKSFRSGIVKHARVAGLALNEIKGVVPHGELEAWMEHNLTFSKETARVYMRIASNWEAIEKAVDSTTTLEQVRRLLAKPKVKTENKPLEVQCSDKPSNVAAVPAAENEVITLRFPDGSSHSKFVELLTSLKEVLNTDNNADAIFQAVQFCCAEKFRGQEDSTRI